MKRLTSLHVLVYSFCSLLFLLALLIEDHDAAPLGYPSFKTSTTSLLQPPKRQAWHRTVPEMEEIAIPDPHGQRAQPALWYHSGSSAKKPLLLVLHSWSADDLQRYSIPYALFARKNDWISLHLDWRGFGDADATVSEMAVEDVLEALAFAKAHAPVDDDRVYLAGFSGGATMSLLLAAGRSPDRVSAVLAWVREFGGDVHGR